MKLEKVSGSQVFKRTCATCGKRHYGDCLLDTGSCFGCVKDGHMVKDCPNWTSQELGKKYGKIFRKRYYKVDGKMINDKLRYVNS